MSNPVEEVTYLKGMATHPNSISVGSGTFQKILNGWIQRDGVIDPRPGFDVDSVNPSAAGLLYQPGTTNRTFAGAKTIGNNTFVQNDGRLWWYQPTGDGSGMVAISAGDTENFPSINGIAVGSSYIAVAPAISGTTTAIMVYSITTGELIASALTSVVGTGVNGMAFDNVTGKLWWADLLGNKVHGGTIGSGTITVTDTVGDGTAALANGSLATCKINSPVSVCIYNTGAVLHVYLTGDSFVFDANITANTGTLIAGATASGYVNATGASARFSSPNSIGYFNGSPANLYVADFGNNAIRLVTTAGVATTFAGSTAGTSGSTDGIGTAARFNRPVGVLCVSSSGTNPDGSSFNGLTENTLFIMDRLNSLVRNIQLSTATVSTMIGFGGYQHFVDGTAITAQLFSLGGACAFATDNATTNRIKILFADNGINGASLGGNIRCIDAYNPTIANNGVPGTSGGVNAAVVSTFGGGQNGSVGSPPSLNRSGYLGGIYNYNVSTPAVTAQASTKFNLPSRLFSFSGTTYFNTTRGVMSMDLPSAYTTAQIAHYAGAPQGYDIALTLVGAPGTLLANDTTCAYRIVWGYKTASGRSIQGAPSSRFIITNSAGAARNVQAVSLIPIGASTSWVYQLYRTDTIAAASATIDPGDTMFLVYENIVTNADLLAGTVTVTDSTPNAFLGADLYTNATQETLSQANNQPPLCLDQCLFGPSSLGIYANFTNKQRMFLNLTGVTAFTGSPTIVFTFADGLNGFTITGNNAANADGVFFYYAGGTAAVNVDTTARNIVLTINNYTLNRRVRAFYVSEYNGTPGQIVVEENFVGGQSWSIAATAAIGPMFAPVLPSSGTAYASSADSASNGIMISKVQNPDAVPLLNRFTIGDSSESIRRVLPLRQSLIVIKERSVWRGVGDSPESMVFTLLDNTTNIRADESAAILNNEVYFLTTQGVVAASDNGIRIVSRPIEYQLSQMWGTLATPLDLNGLVTAFGSDDYRCYFLASCNSSDLSARPNFTWIYNVFTNTWTQWDLILQAITCNKGRLIGAVTPVTVTPTAQAGTPQIIKQLNQELFENPLAYYDAGGTINVTAVNNTTKVISASYSTSYPTGKWQYPIANPTTGWIINNSLVIADDGAGNLTVNTTAGLSVASFTAYRPIQLVMESNSYSGGSTFRWKQWGDFFMIIENQNLYGLSCYFATNQTPEQLPGTFPLQTVALTTGNNLDMSSPVGTTYNKEQIFKVMVPKAVAAGNYMQFMITISQAKALYGVKAIGIETRGVQSTKGQQ